MVARARGRLHSLQCRLCAHIATFHHRVFVRFVQPHLTAALARVRQVRTSLGAANKSNTTRIGQGRSKCKWSWLTPFLFSSGAPERPHQIDVQSQVACEGVCSERANNIVLALLCGGRGVPGTAGQDGEDSLWSPADKTYFFLSGPRRPLPALLALRFSRLLMRFSKPGANHLNASRHTEYSSTTTNPILMPNFFSNI